MGRDSVMTSRERVLAAMRRQPVDYVPCAPFVNPLSEVQRRGKPWHFPWDPPGDGLEYWVTVLGTDKVVAHWWIGSIFPDERVTTRAWVEGEELHKIFETPSGTLHAAVRYDELWPFGEDVPFFHDFVGHYTEHWLKSEADVACLEHIILPPRTEEQVARVRRAYAHDKALADRLQLATLATIGSGLTTALWMFGANELPLLTKDDPGLVERYLALDHAWAMRMGEILLDCGVDILQRQGFYETCDYYSPAALERFIGAQVREQIAQAHQAGRPYSYLLYSGVEPMLDYLTGFDFDCLSSLDPAFNHINLDAVQARLGDKKSFWTGPSNTFHMYADNPEVVRQSVREVFRAFGKTGLIISAVSSVHPMMPWENTVAMLEEWRRLR